MVLSQIRQVNSVPIRNPAEQMADLIIRKTGSAVSGAVGNGNGNGNGNG